MASEILAGTGYRAPRERALRGAARVFHGGENVLVSLALGAMAFLPIAEIALRSTLGFGISLVAARLLWHASSRWTGRIVAGALAAVIVWAGSHPFLAPHDLVLPAIAALLVATILGAPVFTTLGGLALIFFWGEEVPIA